MNGQPDKFRCMNSDCQKIAKWVAVWIMSHLKLAHCSSILLMQISLIKLFSVLQNNVS